MFTPIEIEGAFRKLFGMYNQEKVKELKSAFKEEIQHIVWICWRRNTPRALSSRLVVVRWSP